MRLSRILVALVLVATACSSGASPPTTSELPNTTTTASETEVEADPLLELIDELVVITEEIRELEFLEPPTVSVVTNEELAQRVRDIIETELDEEEVRRDGLLLEALGLAKPGTDLADLYSDLYSEQVAGFYDGETGELVVPATGDNLTALEKMTLVHELTHALTDQHFDFAAYSDELDEEERFEEAAAFTALVEGDASLTEILYLTESLSRSEQLEALTASTEYESPVFDRTPRFLQELMLFPYTTGSDFVTEIWSRSGFAGIDRLYEDPPSTTEHIFHPADFLKGEPSIAVPNLDLKVDGYELAEQSVWGQAGFRAMLGQVLDDAVATKAAVGWGGDSYTLLWDGKSNVVFAIAYEADSILDNEETFAALTEFIIFQLEGEVESSGESVTVVGDSIGYVDIQEGKIRFLVATDPIVGAEIVAQWLAP